MIKTLKLISVFLISFQLVFGSETLSQKFNREAELLNEMNDFLTQSCFDEESNIILKDVEVAPGISCVDAIFQLQQSTLLLDLEMSQAAEVDSMKDEDDCYSNDVVPIDNSDPLITSINEIEDANNMQCRERKDQLSGGLGCAKDFLCQTLNTLVSPTRSLLQGADGLINSSENSLANFLREKVANKIKEKWDQIGFENTCPAGDSSCIMQIFNGVITALWSNVELASDVWEWMKKAPGKAWDGIKGTYQDIREGKLNEWFSNWLFDQDNQESTAMGVVSQISEEALDDITTQGQNSLVDNSFGFMKKIFDGLSDSVKNNFACEKFKDHPTPLECEVPLQSWDCASCNQVINSICGVIGVLGAEVVTSMVVGGALGVISVGGKIVAKGASSTRRALVASETYGKTTTTGLRVVEQSRNTIQAAKARVARLKDLPLYQTSKTLVTNILNNNPLFEGLKKLEVTKDIILPTLNFTTTKVRNAGQRVVNIRAVQRSLDIGQATANATRRTLQAVSESRTFQYSGVRQAYNITEKTYGGLKNGAKWYLKKLDEAFRLGFDLPQNIYKAKRSRSIVAAESTRTLKTIDEVKNYNAEIEEILIQAESRGSLTPDDIEKINSIMSQQINKTERLLLSEGVEVQRLGDKLMIVASDASPMNHTVKAITHSQGYNIQKDFMEQMMMKGMGNYGGATIEVMQDFFRQGTVYHPANNVLRKFIERGNLPVDQVEDLVKSVRPDDVTDTLVLQIEQVYADKHRASRIQGRQIMHRIGEITEEELAKDIALYERRIVPKGQAKQPNDIEADFQITQDQLNQLEFFDEDSLDILVRPVGFERNIAQNLTDKNLYAMVKYEERTNDLNDELRRFVSTYDRVPDDEELIQKFVTNAMDLVAKNNKKMVEQTEQFFQSNNIAYKKVKFGELDGLVISPTPKDQSPLNLLSSQYNEQAANINYIPGAEYLWKQWSGIRNLAESTDYANTFQKVTGKSLSMEKDVYLGVDDIKRVLLQNQETFNQYEMLKAGMDTQTAREIMETTKKGARNSATLSGSSRTENSTE